MVGVGVEFGERQIPHLEAEQLPLAIPTDPFDGRPAGSVAALAGGCWRCAAVGSTHTYLEANGFGCLAESGASGFGDRRRRNGHQWL